MQASATLKRVRLSPRKARLVVDLIRGKTVADAANILEYSDKKAACIIRKLLDSAAANARHLHNVNEDELWVERIFVNEGRPLKRVKPRARGRADRIQKPTSHIEIQLVDRNN